MLRCRVKASPLPFPRGVDRHAVGHACQAGMSWALIGSLIGASGEAARQRYDHPHKIGH